MQNPDRNPMRRLGAVPSLPLLAALMLTVALAAGAARAQYEEDTYAAPSLRQQLDEIDRSLQISDGLPNEKARLYGLRAYLKGNYAEAARSFKKAARYADKYSQHRLSLLYWEGRGVARDLALSYVWSELAAERGTPNLVQIRRSMWAGLNAAERARSVSACATSPASAMPKPSRGRSAR